jgi:GTP-binding protein
MSGSMDSVVFIKSAVLSSDYPQAHLPEVAVVGRSNAGKSSLLNSLAKKKIAFVSQVPGKTALINFFQVGRLGCLVDLPGYGYAKRSKSEIQSWQEMIEVYLSTRETLRGLLIVIDLSRDLESEEEMILNFAQSRRIPLALILTKKDRLRSNEARNRIQKVQEQTSCFRSFVVSNKTGEGIVKVDQFITYEWFKKGSGGSL